MNKWQWKMLQPSKTSSDIQIRDTLYSRVYTDCIYIFILMYTFLVLVTYVKGQRHLPYLLIGNHKYNKHRSSQKATYWKCHLYDSGVCKARLTTHFDQTLKMSAEHNHKPLESFEHFEVISEELYDLVK